MVENNPMKTTKFVDELLEREKNILDIVFL